ncbi:hypothetical protein IF1G_05826 [Cordyceps javanica]|uniref:Uncharacterized protein n=1 Tax=Cordyceps javanica TaxID=43265 RepID=A0A545V2S0_9HYPO|nr:hypothetical protein IF1G_05826 [Cordyceps javanica]
MMGEDGKVPPPTGFPLTISAHWLHRALALPQLHVACCPSLAPPWPLADKELPDHSRNLFPPNICSSSPSFIPVPEVSGSISISTIPRLVPSNSVPFNTSLASYQDAHVAPRWLPRHMSSS